MENYSLYERCVALSASSLLNERQIGWTGRWSLMGDFVVCTQCLEAQPIDLADHPFTHSPECVAVQYGRYPWHELVAVLNQIPSSSHELTH